MPTPIRRPDPDTAADDELDLSIDDDPDPIELMAGPRTRVCTEPGCTTVLSRYNATNWCGVHHRRDWRATREPRRRSA